MIYPEIINKYNVYKNISVGDEAASEEGKPLEQMMGVSGQVQLPTLEAVTETLSGSGLLGELEITNPGHFSAFDMTIPYVAICDDMFAFNMSEQTTVTLRASEQSTEITDKSLVYRGLKVIVGGRVKSFTLGNLEEGKRMESSLVLSVNYIKVDALKDDGSVEKTLLELDKYSNVFVVNGTDQLAKIKNLT